jgi:hypothetical protein
MHGKRSGVNTTNVGRSRMWTNRKMKFVAFTFNDDAKCLCVVTQGTHKLVVMVHINFEGHALIKI